MMRSAWVPAVWHAVAVAAVLCGWVSGVAASSDISRPGDFGQVAKRGFAETIQGSFYIDSEKTLFPNLLPDVGSVSNSYSWSMAWFQNALWVGTVREVHSGDRVAAGPAEVWRYQPSADDLEGDFGLSGTWSRIYVAPNVEPWVTLLTGGDIPPNFPRYFGFRNMAVCNAGNDVSRLYMTATGLPPAILYWNGNTFVATSSSGLPTSVFEIGAGTGDLGFRGLACFKGRLFVSPAGTLDDVDAANNPVLLMNANPAGGAAWQTVVDVKNQGHPLADPNNIGIFQVEAIGDYLWMSVSNRTTGFELWRGDGSNCQEPWVGSTCNITWAKIIDNGAGRPPEDFGPDISNAGATLGVFGNDLYVAPAESGFAAVTLAELLRVQNANTPPNPGNRAEPHQWQLLAGWPRKDFAQPDKRLPGLENLDCAGFEFDMPNAGQEPELWSGGGFFGRTWLSPSEMDDDTDIDDCRPRTGSGPGLAVDGPYLDPLLPGPNSYLWRMAEHDGSFFIGSLNVLGTLYPGVDEGFNLYKTHDGIDFELIVDNGLGNPAAYGARSLVSTPIGLALGTANGFPYFGDLDTAGTDVHIGTTTAGNQAAPKADAGPDQLVFDTGQTGWVNASLMGAGEPTFGGSLKDDGPYEWFEGSIASLGGNCSGIAGTPLSSDPENPNLNVNLASLVDSQDVNQYTFTLRVTNAGGRASCDEVTITASYNLPPTVHHWFHSEYPLHTSVPTSFGHSPPRVAMIDFDGDGVESYDVTAYCSDPEAALVRCEFEVVDVPGVSLSSRMDTVSNPSLCVGQQVCEISARLTVPSSVVRPEVRIVAEDAEGFEDALSFRSVTRPVVDTPDVNDAPVCRSVDVTMFAGVAELVIDPASFDPPICVDPDGDSLTYQSRNPAPSKGTATFGSLITYAPGDPNTPMVDQIEFRAWDPSGLSSSSNPGSNSVIRVTLIDCVEDLTLTGETISGAEAFYACNTLTAGPDFTVAADGNLLLRAGSRIILRPGFRVLSGGSARAVVDPQLNP